MTSPTFDEASFVAENFPNKPAESYLDTAAIGLVPEAVRKALNSYTDATGRGMLGSSAWQPVTAGAHARIADEFGVAPERLSSLATTGEAMNATARAIPWESGDEILVFSDDFPTVHLPWRRLGQGTRVVELAPPADEDRTSTMIEALGPRTRVVSITHVHATTGSLVDLTALGRACHSNGTLLVVDGAQSAGAVRLDLDETDVYIGAAYKWLLAGFGFTTVVTSARFTDLAKPGLLGYANRPPSGSLVYGHRNLAGMYAVGAAAEVRSAFGLDRSIHRTHLLVARLHKELTALDFRPLSPLDRSAGIVTVAGLDGENLAGALGDRGVVVASRQGMLRISPYFYTADQELDRFLDTFSELAPKFRVGPATS
ncbi:aminotransferase class V-fold PLP-dependent enzyme [Paenarthrobacter sp. NPDC056912]|uniref:aminotransferase class V-fold PLP-dependent enzyme n=1 Tax=Paenarthrobacter sp. NPDC056912 TaxID=3345965 RepID=UPI00366C9DED